MPVPRLAVDMSSDTLRVLEGQIGEPMRSGEATVPPGSMDGGRVIDPQAVGQALRSLIARSEITASRALIAVSDALATFRVLTFPNSATESEIEAEVSIRLNLGSDGLAARHVDVPVSTSEKTVFAVVWDRAQVDAIALAARNAGLEPIAADLKSLCLARAVGVETCLFIDTTDEPGEVVLIAQRIPRVRHTFKSGPDGYSAEAILDALKAVVAFQLRSRGAAFAPESPIIVRSIQPLSSLIARRLSEVTGRPVEPVAQPARIDGDVRFGPYLTCLGLLMRRSV